MTSRLLIAAGAVALGLGFATAASAQGMQQPTGGQMQPGMSGGTMQSGTMGQDDMQAQKPMRSKKMKRTSSRKMKKQQNSM